MASRDATETGMKGDPKVIELLNEALKAELTAINQYWLHYRMLDNWGVKKLAEFERGESIDEMKHADRFAERILFLDGLPNFQALGRLRIGENVEEILKADLEAEYEAVAMYKEGAAYCESVKDFVSRDLFTDVLATEEHQRRRRLLRERQGFRQPRPLHRRPRDRGASCRHARDAVRDDRPHGDPELRAASERGSRGVIPLPSREGSEIKSVQTPGC